MSKHLRYAKRDLAARIPGREDPPEMVEDCVKYFRQRNMLERDRIGVEDRTRSALALARVQTSVVDPRVHELERQVRLQEATINRLLAFVPARSETLESSQLEAIVRKLVEIAQVEFAPAPIAVGLTPENDTSTTACHRITVTVFPGQEANIETLVDAELNFRRRFVDLATPDDIRAVALIVDIKFPA